MGRTPQPDDLMRRLRRVEEELAALRKRAGLGSAVISRGGLEVRHPNGEPALRVGEFEGYSGEQLFGVAIRRADGSLAMWAWSDDTGANGYWSVMDRSGNIIMSDDAVSGQGLATPWLPVPFEAPTTVVPDRTTVSGSYETLQQAVYAHQHPKLWVRLLVRSSAGDTTGQVRLTADGVLVGSEIDVAASDFKVVDIGPSEVAGAHMGFVDLTVQARRTAGTGTIGVRVVAAYAEQS